MDPINWEDPLTVLAVPGKQPIILTQEEGELIREQIRKKRLTRESREVIVKRVKPLLGKPVKTDA
jgi:hypothetical protein